MKRLNGTKGQRARKVPALNHEIGKPEVSLAKNNHNGRYRQWLDSLMEGCQIIDFDWRYLYVDGTAIKHSRRSREGSLGHTVMEAHPGIEHTEIFSGLRHSMEERTPDRMDDEFLLVDGTKGWFTLEMETVPEGTLVPSLDITDCKRTEEASRASGKGNRLLVDNAGAGIVLTQNGKLGFVDARFRETMGYSSEKELISRPSLELMHPDDRETTREYCPNRLRGKKTPSTYAVRAIDREGNTK